MKILLITPLLLQDYLSNFDSRTKAYLHKIVARGTYHRSLSLPIIAAVTPKKHSITIIKKPYNKIKIDETADIIGIRTTTSDCYYGYKIADEYRKKGITVVIGGWHASALPTEAKQHADSVVVGEGEESWPQLLEDYEKGELKPFYFQKRSTPAEKIPIPIRKISKGFLPAVQATRGCPYQCEFCAETIMNYRKNFRARPIENVIKEIKAMPGKDFIFHDASLTINPDYSKKLFKELIPIKKSFFCNGNADTLARDDELLKIAKKAGCVGWLIGLESISQQSINSIGKKTNIVERYTKAIDKIHKHKMMVQGSFVFGFDGDTLDVFDRTFNFVEQSNIDMPDAMILTPFPSTPFYMRLDKENRLLTKDWRLYDYRHVVYEPKNMTPDELFDNTKDLFQRFYKFNTLTKRVIKSYKLGLAPFVSTFLQNLTMASLEMKKVEIVDS